MLKTLLPGLMVMAFVLVLQPSGIVHGATYSVALAWDPHPDPSVTGFRVHYGTRSGSWSNSVLFGKVNNVAVSGLSGSTNYFFAAKAIRGNGEESDYSNEVSTRVPRTNTTATIVLAAPLDNAVVTARSTLILKSTVVANGQIPETVKFFDGLVLLGEDRTAPYTFSWPDPLPGPHELSTHAVSSNGTVVASPITRITATNAWPKVSVTKPVANAGFIAPASIALAASVSSNHHIIHKVQFYNGNTLLGEDATAPYALSWNNVSAGTYGVTARVFSDLGFVITSAAATVKVTPTLPLQLALDTSDLLISSSGSSAWMGQILHHHDGVDSARSGSLANGQTNWIETTVTGPGTVSYWWNVSSQTNSDHLRFFVDDVELGRISGEPGWRQGLHSLAKNFHRLRWSYTKDASGRKGLDAGWVDQLTFAGVPPQAGLISASGSIRVGGTVNLEVLAEGTPVLVFQWQKNGTNMVDGTRCRGAKSPRMTLLNAQPEDTAGYTVRISSNWGTALSQAFFLTVLPADVDLLSTDVGVVGVAGGMVGSGEQYTVSGAGELTSTSDSFQFAHVPLHGDGGLVARVSPPQTSNPDGRTGLMIRESLSAGSAYAFIGFSTQGALYWQIRTSQGGPTVSSSPAPGGPAGATPWLKLTRAGTRFTGETSTDGTNWIAMGSGLATMPTELLSGLAVASGDAGFLVPALFEQVTLIP